MNTRLLGQNSMRPRLDTATPPTGNAVPCAGRLLACELLQCVATEIYSDDQILDDLALNKLAQYCSLLLEHALAKANGLRETCKSNMQEIDSLAKKRKPMRCAETLLAALCQRRKRSTTALQSKLLEEVIAECMHDAAKQWLKDM